MKNTILFYAALAGCFCISQASASVFLYNDSPFQLKAAVIDATGATVGEKVLAPQETGYMEDSQGQANPTNTGPVEETPQNQSQQSVTPYSVYWYCPAGASFSVNTNIGAGALASATGGEGAKYCQPKKAQEENAPQQAPSQ